MIRQLFITAFILALFVAPVHSADTTIPELPELSVLADGDLFLCLDASNDNAFRKCLYSSLVSNITDATDSVKGIASFSSDYFTVSSGAVSLDLTAFTLTDLTFDVGDVSKTEFGYLDGATSNLQTQITTHTSSTSDPHEVTGAQVSFADTDGNFSATSVGAAIEELDDVNPSGINASDGKVDWTQLTNVPAGIADGSDDGGVGGSGSMTTVKVDGVQVGGADIIVLDFTSPLSAAESPDTEVNVTIDDAAADGSTKGAATFQADQFNASGGVISLDLTNLTLGDLTDDMGADPGHTHTGTSISGIDVSDDTNLAVDANELTLTGDSIGLADHATARSALGLAIGADVQAYDADLTTYGGITPSANVQSLLGAATYAAMRGLLDLEAGTDFYSVSAADAAFVADTGDQTVAGVKTFSSFPVTPSAAPTTDYQVANKKYVDDNISSGTVDISGSPVANDIARFTDSNSVEGRSYSELKADLDLEIGTDVLAQQTIGIGDGNLLEVDGTPVDNEYARFTATGLEGRTEAEFKADFNLEIGTDVLAQQAVGIADDNLLEVDDADAADDDYAKLTANGVEGRSYAEVKADLDLEIGTDVLAQQTIGIADDNLLEVDGTPNDDEYARFTANGIEGRTEAEFKADFNLEIGTDVQAYDADLTTYGGITPAANVQSLLGAANYAAMRGLLDLEAGTDFYSVSAADAAFVADTGDQTVAGVKTFSSFPVTPSAAPTTDYQAANKKYVDDNAPSTFALTSEGTVADDIAIRFGGAATDWYAEFDDSVDDQFLIHTTADAAAATTDPMFQILTDFDTASGTNMTADQQVFGIAKGTQATNVDLLTLDEDGDLVIAGSLTSNSSGDSYLQLTNNASIAPSGNRVYFEGNELTVSENGNEESVLTDADGATLTGTTWSFLGVTNMVLPSAAADASGEISMSTGNQLKWHDGTKVVTIDTTPTTDDYVLKYDNATATFTLEADETGGTPAWNSVTAPTADVNLIHDAGEETQFTFTGNFTTGNQFNIEQLTGNPTGGVLFQVKAADADVTAAQIGDGTNMWTFSPAGLLTNTGTATLNFAAASDLTVGGGQIDYDDMAGSGNISTSGTAALGVTTVTGLVNTSVGLDAVGAVDMDYGSADVTDHTFVSDGGTVIIDGSITAVGENLGSATAEWNDLYLNDGGVIQLGNDQDVTITHVADSGITLAANSEDLTYAATANTWTLSSSTGVTDVSLSAMNLATTGAITGRVSRGADITANTSHDTTETHGVVYMFTAVATVTLDAAADAGYGATVCYRVRDAEVATIDVDAAEKINLEGTALTAGYTIDSSGAAGEFVCLMATTDTDGSGTDGWETWGLKGTWSDGGAT